jgi:hypothetical protein
MGEIANGKLQMGKSQHAIKMHSTPLASFDVHACCPYNRRMVEILYLGQIYE